MQVNTTQAEISGEWLETIGFQRKETASGNIYWQRGLLTFWKRVEFCCEPLEHVKTRQQMLNVIAVLLPAK